MTLPTPRPSGRAMRCRSCGGLNTASAQWCGQCLVSFQPGSRSAESESANPWASEPFDPLTAPHVSFVPEQKIVRRGAFVVVGNEISWSCSACMHDNPLDAQACGVCGSSFAVTVIKVDRPHVRRDPRTVALYSLLFPGAGHLYLGLVGQGIARAVMSIWVVVVAAVALFSGGGGPGVFVWTTYGAAAVALWVATTHDAYREANGQPGLVLLSPRRSLYVTLALIAVLFCVVTFGALEARGSAGV